MNTTVFHGSPLLGRTGRCVVCDSRSGCDCIVYCSDPACDDDAHSHDLLSDLEENQ